MVRALENQMVLIPGLSDDVAIAILARISHGYRDRMQAVCRRWRSLFRSSELADAQARQGWCGDWLLVLTDNAESGRWNAFDPEAERWHLLPPSSEVVHPVLRHLGFGCCTVSRKLLVIGGFFTSGRETPPRYYATNQVLQFDLITGKWSELARMRVARCNFACAVVDGKVYVSGGSTSSRRCSIASAEVYDPKLNQWEVLPPLSVPRDECVGVCFRGMFYVVAGLDSSGTDDLQMAEVYDPAAKAWHRVPGFWLLSRKIPCPLISFNGCLYALDDWSRNSVKIHRPDASGWETLSVDVGDDLRKLLHMGLAGMRNKLYVFGGVFISSWSVFQCRSSDSVFVLPTSDARPGDDLASRVHTTSSMIRGMGAVVGSAVHAEIS